MTQLTVDVTKRAIADTTAFAINHIPDVDKPTLKKFLELVNIEGAHGSLTHQQFIEKAQALVKYVPDTDIKSLTTLADLLNVTPKPSHTVGTGMLAEPHLMPPSNGYQAILN